MKQSGIVKTLARVAALVLFAAAAIGPLGAAGCREQAKAKPLPAPQEQTTQPAKLVPDLPGDEQPQSGMELLVKNPKLDRTINEGGYKVEARTPVGRLVGACKWSGPVIRENEVPPPKALEFTGDNAIKDPAPGEVEYCQNLRLKERQYVGTYRGFFPTSVAIMIRGIKHGPVSMFSRANFMVRYGDYTPHMQFAPVGERVMFGTYDSYPTHVLMKNLATGNIVLDEIVAAFNRDTIKPLPGGGTHYTERPKMIQSTVVDAPGVYPITARRHLWKSAYVIFVDNPYAVVSDSASFSIENIPVGTWAMDVWHPEFKPVKETIEIQIRKDETTEIPVEFLPPDFLKPKPAAK